MGRLLGLLHLRPGETRQLLWVCAIAVAYIAATGIGNDVAEAIFITRVGEGALPLVFLAKGLLDVVAAALYLPLARGRDERRVWLAALAVYVTTVLTARAVITGGSDISAFALFVGHETAWTILTIHWGVFLLHIFDASQARRLFPVLFTTARLGGVLAGVAVSALAGPIGVANLLFGCAAAAVIAGTLTILRPVARRGHELNAGIDTGPRAEIADAADQVPSELEAAGASSGLLRSWRVAVESPLVRAIALSTAAMVVIRYSMQLVALGEINRSFASDAEVAAFLGSFAAIANGVSIVLGVFVVPRLLVRYGVGAANVLYALSTVAANVALLFWPSLSTAAGARFVRVQLKDALKTPLSTLFYGAEPPRRRVLARAFIFGASIPAATVVAAVVLEVSRVSGAPLQTAAIAGTVASVLFVGLCWSQNRRWRCRLAELLAYKLANAQAPDANMVHRVREAIGAAHIADFEAITAGLASADSRIRAVAEELLAERIPRRRAHNIAARLRQTSTQ